MLQMSRTTTNSLESHRQGAAMMRPQESQPQPSTGTYKKVGQVLTTQLNSKNKVQAVNTDSVPVVIYVSLYNNLTEADRHHCQDSKAKGNYRKERKVMEIQGICSPSRGQSPN